MSRDDDQTLRAVVITFADTDQTISFLYRAAFLLNLPFESFCARIQRRHLAAVWLSS